MFKFSNKFSCLLIQERYTDVTLACEGKFYKVHKLVLSTCSAYFENMFDHTPCKHPVIVLSEIHWEELEALLSYMYAGFVNVAENSLARLIKVAELLEVKGLAVPDEPQNSRKRSSDSQWTNENRKSPLSGSKQLHSGSDDGNTHSRSYTSSDGRKNPHVKRERTRDSVSSLESIQSPNKSPLKESSRLTESEQNEEIDTSWSEANSDSQRNTEGNEDQASLQHQEHLIDEVQVCSFCLYGYIARIISQEHHISEITY